jgi:hypothetical protein
MSEPFWLDPILTANIPPAAFGETCRQAATAAAAVYRLRLTRERLDPRPASIRTYLQELTRVADVPLGAVTAWAGLDLDRGPDPSFASAWGRLAAALRLGWQDVLLQLRLTLLEVAGTRLTLSSVRARGGAGDPEAARAQDEQDVTAALAGWDADRLAHLRACEDAARQAFATSPV